MPRPPAKVSSLLLVLGIPALVLGAIWAGTRPRPGASAPGTVALEAWPEGEPRTTSRVLGAGREERCFFTRDGEALGCGTLENGKPWSGTLVDWASRNPSDPLGPALISTYRDGKRHGTWRSFHPDGEPHIELVYEDDALKSRRIVGRTGNETLATPPAALPKGTLPISPAARPAP